MSARRLLVEADGGSRGNPGVAGYGALVRDRDTGVLLAERAEPLGTASNNVAEYEGLIAGLEAARDLDAAADVEVRMDSKLVVEQMSGRWKIKHEDMRRLALRARGVVTDLEEAGGAVRFTWIPRAENTAADTLSNLGMDGESVHVDHESEPARPPGRVPADDDGPQEGAASGPSRVLLVAEVDGDPAAAARSAGHLVRDAAVDVLTARAAASRRTGEQVARALGAVPVPEDRWDAPEEAAAALRDLLTREGTRVVVCPAEAVRAALADALGVPTDRRSRIAVAPGSLSALQTAGDGEVVVAFTNRT